jgi:hypothetical protein
MRPVGYHFFPVTDICNSGEGDVTEAVKNAYRRNEPKKKAEYRIGFRNETLDSRADKDICRGE